MQAFPLQHKKMQRLVLPYLRVGTCEVMNASPFSMMDSFHAFNTKNTSVYEGIANSASNTTSGGSSGRSSFCPPSVPFMGQLVAGGLVDSYTGGAVSRFVSMYLSRAMSLHTTVPSQVRDLRKEFPEDPLVDLMTAAIQRHRALHQPRFAPGSGAPSSTSQALRSIVSDTDMHQYAVSTDAAFFRACSVLANAQQSPLAGFERDNGGQSARQRKPVKLTRHDKHLADLLVAAMEDAAATGPPGAGGGDKDDLSVDRLQAVRDSGCRAAWFAATVAPTALELQRRLALLREQSPVLQGTAGGASPPPPRRGLDSHESVLQREIDELKAIGEEQPFCLDVVVSNVGDSRAFGIARNRHTEGSRSLLDPTRERVVPLSIDHRPFRQEEFHRITQAGGRVESAAGEVIDGNPFYNVSRSFGHWPMKSDPKRSPVQQKLSAVPHTSTWRMLAGDVLVLANHAVFETRHEEDSSVDEVAKVVGRELDRGAEPEQVAAALCDFAIRFGASHTLQVMVAVATKPGAAEEESRAPPVAGPAPQFSEWTEPGPLYVEACRHVPALREAFVRDCARCRVSPADMVAARWQRVRELLPQRHALSLMPFYGRECGVLQQVMEEEAMFFDQDALRKADELLRAGPASELPDASMRDCFQRLAKSLVGAKTH